MSAVAAPPCADPFLRYKVPDVTTSPVTDPPSVKSWNLLDAVNEASDWSAATVVPPPPAAVNTPRVAVVKLTLAFSTVILSKR